MAGDGEGPTPQPAQLTKAQRALLVAKGKREDIFARVQLFYDNLVNIKETDYSTYKSVLDRLQILRERFDTIQNEIIEYNTWVPAAEILPVTSVSR